MKPTTTNISSLTPLRGIAALGVAVFHFQVYLLRFVTKDQSMLIDKGYLMVDLFFIMSGFLIMHVYKEDFVQQITLKKFKKFILARFARIYPLHFFTLLLLIGLFLIKSIKPGGIYDPRAILSHVFLLHSFPLNSELTWNVPSWSIGAEWWAYILFPVLCLLLYRYTRLGVIFVILCIVASYILLLFYVPGHRIYNADSLDITFDYGFLRGIAGFMTGMLLYLVYGFNWIKRIFNSDLICGAYILLVLFALHKGIPDIYFVPGFSILILLLTINTGKISLAFNNRAFTFLGEISYSVYMIHFLLIIFIQMMLYTLGYRSHSESIMPFLKGFSFCLLYLLILGVLSSISYHILEKPCRKYINQKWANKTIAPINNP